MTSDDSQAIPCLTRSRNEFNNMVPYNVKPLRKPYVPETVSVVVTFRKKEDGVRIHSVVSDTGPTL